EGQDVGVEFDTGCVAKARHRAAIGNLAKQLTQYLAPDTVYRRGEASRFKWLIGLGHELGAINDAGSAQGFQHFGMLWSTGQGSHLVSEAAQQGHPDGTNTSSRARYQNLAT